MKQAMRRLLQFTTVAYAVVLVVATHIPRLDVAFASSTPVPPDKLLHFAAYGVLGFLVGLIAAGSALNWRRWFPTALSAIAVFALLDETTQPMFGRAAETFDWVADVIGAATGLIVAAGVAAIAGFSGQTAIVAGENLRSLKPMDLDPLFKQLKRAVITAAGQNDRQLMLQRLVDRDGKTETAFETDVPHRQAAASAAASLTVIRQTEPRGYGDGLQRVGRAAHPRTYAALLRHGRRQAAG